MRSVYYASLFTITGEQDGQIITTGGGRFDTTKYSRFKYGDRAAATEYGRTLTDAIIECASFQSVIKTPENIVITASAYKSLPTAAQAVADVTIATLHERGYHVRHGRIHRDTLTEGDYGAMSVDERAYWMSCNGLWVEASQFEGRHVIVVDDVSISGAHGRSIVAMFEQVDIASLTLVHVLQLTPELALRDPKIEDRMNHSVIRTLDDLQRLIGENPDYTPNARTVKFILSQPIEEIERFLRGSSQRLIHLLRLGMQADEYDRMRSYEGAAWLITGYSQPRLTRA